MKNEKTHVAVYRRVDAEDTEQETSNRLLASADERRINTHPSWLYAGTYIDSGMERTAFRRLMKIAGEGDIDRIETKSISDFSNNIGELLATVCRLRCLRHPVEIHFEEEDVNTGTDDWEHCVCFLMGCLKSMYRKPRIICSGRRLRIG